MTGENADLRKTGLTASVHGVHHRSVSERSDSRKIDLSGRSANAERSRDRVTCVSSPALPACSASGRSVAISSRNRGVTTMKVTKSTRMTSTSGATSMSERSSFPVSSGVPRA